MRILLTAALLLLVACATDTNQKRLKQLGMEEIAKRRFDIETFNRNKIKEYEDIPGNNDQIYEFVDSMGICHEQGSTDNVYYEVLTYPDSLVCDAYVFYASGTIKSFARALVKGTADIGNEVHFDEQGNVTEVINHDEHHPFTLEQVLAYMKENDIDIWNKYVRITRRIELFEEEPPIPYSWIITIELFPEVDFEELMRQRKPIPPLRERTIELDAVTGKVVKDTIEEVDYNRYRKYD